MAYYIAEGAIVKGQVTMADSKRRFRTDRNRQKFEYTGQCGGTCGLKPQCQNR